MSNKKFWDNSSLQEEIKWDNQQLPGITDEELYSTNWNMRWAKTDQIKQRISNTMRGKSLEELVGPDKAARGRQSRSEFHRGRKRPPEIGEQVAATRKANGSYESPNHGMRGKIHSDETKSKQSVKARIRQDLKRKLGLGKNDSVPKDLIEREYKKHGL